VLSVDAGGDHPVVRDIGQTSGPQEQQLTPSSSPGIPQQHRFVVHGLPIRTPSLVLRHFVLDDAEPILPLNAEPSTKHWLPSHVYADLPAAKAALAHLISCYSKPGHPRRGPYVLAVERNRTGRLLGHVGFSPLDDEVEVSYAIAESERGQGFGAEALFHGCEWASKVFGLPSFLAVTATANVASRHTLGRASFIHETDEVMHFQGTRRPVSRYIWRAHTGRDGAA